MITKDELDLLVKRYQTSEFINGDPIQFIHQFDDEEDITITALLASCLAYGNRKVFIQKIDELLSAIGDEPYNFVMNVDPYKLVNFNYRFAKDYDIIALFKKLSSLYKNGSSIKELFKKNYKDEVIPMLQGVCDYFYDGVQLTQGYCHLIPNPRNGGALKRLNMFLRWMVRKPPVDLGLWDFIPTSKLLIPFDVHVARISREMGLLGRNSDDCKAVIELTERLKNFDSIDPVKYDFALFGYGVTHPKNSALVR